MESDQIMNPENIMVIENAEPGLVWSQTDKFPALVYGRFPEGHGQVGWWLFWYNPKAGEVFRYFIPGTRGERSQAEEQARKHLELIN